MSENQSEQVEATETEATEPKAEKAPSEAQVKKAKAAEQTKAHSKELTKLAKLAEQIAKAEGLRKERNDLIAQLVAAGVERSAIQEKSGLTVPRFRQVVSAK